MKTFLLGKLPPWLVFSIKSAMLILNGDYLAQRRRLTENELGTRAVTTLVLREKYDDIAAVQSANPTDLRWHEARVYSQNGENSILLDLFSRIGVTDRRFVEFGMGDGRICNTANLSLNFGWSGLLLDAIPANVVSAQAYYLQRLGKDAGRVQIIHSRVTSENINDTLWFQRSEIYTSQF